MRLKALLTAFLVVASCASAKAEDLADFGISGMKVMTEAAGSEVRGQGAQSVGMAAFQMFAFDYMSGSSINLQSSSINLADSVNTGAEIVGFEALSDAFVGISAVELTVDAFTVSTTGFEIGSLGGGLSGLFGELPEVHVEPEAPEVPEVPEVPAP
ncbi:MAG: hypothetical protein P8M30_14600 [Planctomycetaceae bacterium]|nr:hypothetical protein [Planctomycetaceae bacterium]